MTETWPVDPEPRVTFKFGDHLRFISDGNDRELLVTSEPTVTADGSVSFTVADPEAYERVERMAGLFHGEEMTDTWPADTDPRPLEERIGDLEEPRHRAARTPTAEEASAIASKRREKAGQPLPTDLTRVRLSEGSAPSGAAEFFDAEVLARINARRPPAGLFEGEATR